MSVKNLHYFLKCAGLRFTIGLKHTPLAPDTDVFAYKNGNVVRKNQSIFTSELIMKALLLISIALCYCQFNAVVFADDEPNSYSNKH